MVRGRTQRGRCGGSSHLGWRRLVSRRPALEGLLHGRAPLRRGLAAHVIATHAPQVRLLLGVVLELQLVDIELQPRRDKLAHGRLRGAVELGGCEHEEQRVSADWKRGWSGAARLSLL